MMRSAQQTMCGKNQSKKQQYKAFPDFFRPRLPYYVMLMHFYTVAL
jgi:hypothetical protein